MFTHILFPTDGSPASDQAAETAIGLAKSEGARITAYHAIPPYLPPIPEMTYGYMYLLTPEEYEKGARRDAAAFVARVAALARAQQIEFDSVVETAARPWEAIVKAAEGNRCDLIAMASHGRKGLAGLLLGSETQKVLTHASIPVLVCR